MPRKRNKIINNITRFGYFKKDPYIFKQSEYYNTLNPVPELIIRIERLGMETKTGYSFGGYRIGKNLVGEMLYQLKILFNWDTKAAYMFFRANFMIDDHKDMLEVIYIQGCFCHHSLRQLL